MMKPTICFVWINLLTMDELFTTKLSSMVNFEFMGTLMLLIIPQTCKRKKKNTSLTIQPNTK